MRLHAVRRRMTPQEADILEYYLNAREFVTKATVYERTGDVVVNYCGSRQEVVDALCSFDFVEQEGLAPEQTGRELNNYYKEKLTMRVVWQLVKRVLLPAGIRAALAVLQSIRYIWNGVQVLAHGRIEVPVLDATAITVSLLRGDYKTAGSIMFLLGIGEILEEWTHKKSVDDLARTMSLNVDKVWRIESGQEVLVPVGDVCVGDEIVVRTGNMIPLDGKVISGEATVNQASMTGESLPVRKEQGSFAYAGTVVEEGICRILVEKDAGSGRYDRIVSMIEESEKLKSESEARAAHIADHLVPYSLGGTALVWLLTRNVSKALSILMVDFSCALKLAMPISVLSAMKEASEYNISVKGGKFMEAVSEANTIVFDKTGTLTYATPTVADVVTFGERDPKEMLRLAACLEEHYPHSIANAVVKEAYDRGLLHEEKHSKVEYVVAHGISSRIDDQKVVVGSYHFIFEDEGVSVPEEERGKFESLPNEYSHLYMAVSGELAAVILIADPIREEAPEVIRQLKDLGISKVVMMTGDSDRTARAVAAEIGVDQYFSEVLPEDKAAFIRSEHEQGRKVIMIGDGVNDSPALSEADAGIAISDGAAIAREIADITIADDDLYSLVTLRKLSQALMKRIDTNYRTIIGFNGGLIALGVAGILPPTTSALLHNASTLMIGLHSMTDLLQEPA